MFLIEDNPIIAAIHTKEDFDEAMKSHLNVIFLLKTNIFNIKEYVKEVHKNDKTVFVHADMIEGVARDNYGIEYIANTGADGIISTRINILKQAREYKLKTIQRFFIIDYHSFETAIESMKMFIPDMMEIMPGVLPKIITKFNENVKIPIIAGGLIETKSEILDALKAGAASISTSNRQLWYS